jgi:hypothetical protein
MKILHKIAVLAALSLGLSAPLLVKEGGVKAQAADALSAARPSADLGQSLEAYKLVMLKSDVEGIMSFIYPPFFNLIPKEQAKAYFTQKFTSENRPVVKAIDFTEVGPVQRYSKGQFAAIKYQTKTELPRPGDATPEIDETMTRLLKSKMGPGIQVTIDENRNVVTVLMNTILLAINEQNAGWKVIGKQDLEALVQAKLLPADLVAQLR